MAFIEIPGGLWIPEHLCSNASNFGATNLLLDASAEKAAFIFQIPKTGTLDKFEIRTAAVTLNAASVMRLSFQDVNAAGDPDGTVDQFRTVTQANFAANSWIVPGLITSDGTDGGTKRSVTRGDFLCCVVDYSTFTAADIANIEGRATDASSSFQGFPIVDQFTAAWAKVTASPVIGLKYNDGTYPYIGGHAYPINTTTIPNIQSDTTPDERGMIFRFPAAVKVGGCFLRLGTAVGLTFRAKLYDSDGSTVLEEVVIDTDLASNTSSRNFFVRFTADRTLIANRDYRLTVFNDSAASNLTPQEFTVNAQALLDSFPGGQNWHLTTRTDGGAWTQTVTERPFFGLLVTAIDDGLGLGRATYQIGI